MSRAVKNILVSCIGVILIAATLGGYFLLGFSKTPASNIGIAFALLAESALFGSMVGMMFIPQRPNNLFLQVGVTCILTLYFVGTVLLLVFSNTFRNNVNWLWSIEVIIISVVLFIIITVLIFSLKINSGDQKIISDRRLMQICEKRIFDLLSVNKNKLYEPQLVILFEKLKYGNKDGATSVDEQIVGDIMKLEKELGLAKPQASGIFDELNALLSQRNAEMADNNRGGF